jgi:Rod binding domain-containing protein
VSGLSGIDGLPTVDRSALPADIRRAPRADQDAFRAALGFEQALVSQMLRSVEALASSAEDAGPAYKDMVPTALAESLAARGGVGLARVLYENLREAR